MEQESATVSIDALLAHEHWLRRVIVDLVDEHEVEDILQETWAAALAKGPLRLMSGRGWLRRVAENQARHRRRGAARRRQREAVAAKQEALPSTEEMVERLHAHQAVAQAVADLAEPYRTAVLLRYFEELPPREIARRLGLPGSTVRSHIERGLQQLRGRLGGTDVRSLAALILAPRFGEPPLSVGLAAQAVNLMIGVLDMAARNKAATAAVLVLFLGIGAWVNADPLERDTPVRPTGPSSSESSATTTQTPVANEPTREPMPEKTTELANKSVPADRIRGSVLDHQGRPLAGVSLVFEPRKLALTTYTIRGLTKPPSSAPARPVDPSDRLGRFAFDCTHEFGRIYAHGDYVTVRTYTPPRAKRAKEEALVVVAPRSHARGRVVNWFGLPIAGVSVVPRLEGLLDIDVPIDHADQIALPLTVTDAKGEFAFDTLPLLPELELEFYKAGYKGVHMHEIGANAKLRVVLRGDDEKAWRVTGTVIDKAGRLLPDATVFLHQTLVKTGGYGEFSIETRFLTPDSRFLAGVPGSHIAARPDVVQKLLEKKGTRIAGVVLKLGGPALGIAGQVLDADGGPVEGRIITLFDVRAVTAMHTVEDFVAGRESKLTGIGKTTVKIDGRTDAAGRFAIRGLERREYRLRIIDAATLTSTTVKIMAGRQDVVVRLPREQRRKIGGIVVTRNGAPLSDIRVTWGLETLASGFRIFASGGTVETDADGRFELSDIPAGDIELSLSGRAILDHRHPLLGVPDGGEVRIQTWALCRFRVEIADKTATQIRVLDGAGEALELERGSGHISFSGMRWRLKQGGRTPVLEVSEAARTLVVLREDEELARHPLALDPAKIEVLVR